jgi:hypothetical protein
MLKFKGHKGQIFQCHTVADKAIGFAPEQPLHVVVLACPASGTLKQLRYIERSGKIHYWFRLLDVVLE